MNNISTYFEQAELALAAYSNFTPEMRPDEYVTALEDNGNGMTAAQATRFASSWRVVTQYTDPITGVSATVFQAVTGGQTCLAIRGTDGPTDIIANDFIPKGAPSTVDYAVHKAVWKKAA